MLLVTTKRKPRGAPVIGGAQLGAHSKMRGPQTRQAVSPPSRFLHRMTFARVPGRVPATEPRERLISSAAIAFWLVLGWIASNNLVSANSMKHFQTSNDSLIKSTDCHSFRWEMDQQMTIGGLPLDIQVPTVLALYQVARQPVKSHEARRPRPCPACR